MAIRFARPAVLIAALAAVAGCSKKDEAAEPAGEAPAGGETAPAAKEPAGEAVEPAEAGESGDSGGVEPGAGAEGISGRKVTGADLARVTEGRSCAGKVERAWTFTDGNGEGALLLAVGAERESKGGDRDIPLAACLFAGTESLRVVRDRATSDAEGDLHIQFIEAAEGVTDLDGDGVAEVTFAYKINSGATDVSPMDLKLLLLEGKDKYIIRGTTIVDFGDDRYGGDKKVDASLKNGPPEFLRHAEALWDRVQESEKFE